MSASRRKFVVPAPNGLERAIAFVSPRLGADRWRSRAMLAWMQHFGPFGSRGIEGAAGHRLRADWTSAIKDADTATRYDRSKVRNIVRGLILGNPYAAGAIQRLVTNVIGRGIKPQCRLQADTDKTPPYNRKPGWQPIAEREAERFQLEAEALFAEFAEVCDVGRRLDFYALQDLIERKLVEDGEILIHFPGVDRRRRRNYPVSFGIELIEADRLGTPIDRITDANVRDGVELDPETREPVAYWIQTDHPGDDKAIFSIGKHRRIPRLNRDGSLRIIHLFPPRRPRQSRGFSEFAPALHVFEDLQRYWEAEIMRARIAACYSAFVKSESALDWQQNAGDADDDGYRQQTLEPGTVTYLNKGEDITFGNPSSPNAQFAAFTEVLLRAIGVCLNLPFELIALDFSKTNYSSARASLLEARRNFQSRQQFLITSICKPIWEMVIREGIATGRLSAPSFRARSRDYLASSWVPPAWGWVDPVKEETAARESIAALLSTHADELAAQGKDFDQVTEQAAREHKRLRALGLPSPWDEVAAPEPADSAGGAAAKKEIEDALAE